MTQQQNRSRSPRSLWSALDPLSRRLLKLAIALSALLVALVAYALAHPKDDSPRGTSFDAISRAAEKTERATGARSVIRAVYASPALTQTLVMSGHTVYDGRTGRSRATMTIKGPRGPLKVKAVANAKYVYVRSPLISRHLPPGRKWMGVDPWLGRTAETTFAGNGDTRAQLELLAAAGGDVETVGEETLGAVRVTRYRGAIDIGRYVAILSQDGRRNEALRYERMEKLVQAPTTVEAWVDDDGLLREARVLTTLPNAPSQSPISMDMRIDFLDFGLQPDVSVPVASEVFNVTPMVRAEQGLLTGESLGAVIHPTGGKPLSPAGFRRRANAMCGAFFSSQTRLEHRALGPMRTLRRLGRAGNRSETSQANILKAYRRAAHLFFEPALRIGERGLRRLGRLMPPPHLTVAYRDYLRASVIGAEATEGEVRALEAGDFDVAQRLQQQIRVHSDRNDRLAKRLGLSKCVQKDKYQGSGPPAAGAPA